MASQVVGIESLAPALARIAREYGEEVDRELQSDLQYAGETAAVDLHGSSPSATGEYAGGWDYRFSAKRGMLTVTVGNAGRHASLTHLLEKGHLNRNGTFTGGRKHIEPAYERAVQILEGRLHG